MLIANVDCFGDKSWIRVMPDKDHRKAVFMEINQSGVYWQYYWLFVGKEMPICKHPIVILGSCQISSGHIIQPIFGKRVSRNFLEKYEFGQTEIICTRQTSRMNPCRPVRVCDTMPVGGHSPWQRRVIGEAMKYTLVAVIILTIMLWQFGGAKYLHQLLFPQQSNILHQSDPALTSIDALRQQIIAQEAARAEYARQMTAIAADIESSFTAADDVPLDPVPEHARRLVL
jgi:hypothetical protein